MDINLILITFFLEICRDVITIFVKKALDKQKDNASDEMTAPAKEQSSQEQKQQNKE